MLLNSLPQEFSLAESNSKSKNHPPGPWVNPWTHLKRISQNRLSYFSELQQRYGEIVLVRALGQHMYLLSNPELIRELVVDHQNKIVKSKVLTKYGKVVLGKGLIADSGPNQKRQRKIIHSACFQARHLPRHADSIMRVVERVTSDWSSGKAIDLEIEMKQIALVAASELVLGTSPEGVEIGGFLGDLAESFLTLFSPLYILRQALPFTRKTEFALEVERVNKKIYQLIAQRREKPGQDLLSDLANWNCPETGMPMPDEQIRDDCISILLPGHVSNIAMLVWTSYLVSQHPEIEEELVREATQVMNSNDSSIEKYDKLTLTKRVVAEAMRLFPPIPIYSYESAEAFQLGDYRIPSGATFMICPYVTHRNSKYWDAPAEFQPDRWLKRPMNAADFQYYPLGGGPRICVGASVAWLEGVLAIASIISRWQLEPVANTPIHTNVTFGLRTHGLMMHPTRRSILASSST